MSDLLGKHSVREYPVKVRVAAWVEKKKKKNTSYQTNGGILDYTYFNCNSGKSRLTCVIY